MGRKTLNRVIGSIYLNRELETWLREQAEKDGVSKSELVNRAVEAYRYQRLGIPAPTQEPAA